MEKEGGVGGGGRRNRSKNGYLDKNFFKKSVNLGSSGVILMETH